MRTYARGGPGGQFGLGGNVDVFCPRCGIAMPARAITCPVCRSDLDLFAQAAPEAAAPVCLRCGGPTPPLPAEPAAYCMHCGAPLRSALAIIPATPDPDLCPLCREKGVRVKLVFQDSPGRLARELAPPRKPFPVRIFGAGGEETGVGPPRATARRRIDGPSLVVRATATGFTLAVWALAGLAVVLLLLAMSKVGSYKELPSTVLQGEGPGAIIAARIGASIPYLRDALVALAAALGLLAIRAAVDSVWHATVAAYRTALKNWESAYYCPSDHIVFIRTATALHWDPVEGFHRLIARDWSGGRD